MEDKKIMLSVRVPVRLKRNLKLRAVKLTISLEQLVVNILQADIDRKGA